MIQCADFTAGRCLSCRWLTENYATQLQEKQSLAESRLATFGAIVWSPIQASAETEFRNKAKMAVSGHWRAPVLGISHADGRSVDLTACPLYPVAFQAVFHQLKQWITLCQLMPYSIAERKGDVKFVLVSYSQSTQQWLIRWVLRSASMVGRLRQQLPKLLADLPAQSVVSVNIQPVDMAVLEGEEEILLTEDSSITYRLNDIPLHCRPKSFFQTNDAVASALYRQAQNWVSELAPHRVWDLFCGVGGFALHCVQILPQVQVTGIEVSVEAIASATLSAQEIGCSSRTEFRALSAQDFSLERHRTSALPEGIIVNPPRRGLGQALCDFLNEAETVQWVIYSSCSLESLAQDLVKLSEFMPVRAQVFDMFPHTQHLEVLVLLVRQQSVSL